jgi:hypothetical protein
MPRTAKELKAILARLDDAAGRLEDAGLDDLALLLDEAKEHLEDVIYGLGLLKGL